MDLILVVPEILPDKNRTQYQRVKYLCKNYKTAILSETGNIPEDIKKDSTVKTFPFPNYLFMNLFFIPWAMIQVLKAGRKVTVYTTFDYYSSVTGSAMKFLGYSWIADMWDDPHLPIEIIEGTSSVRNRFLKLLIRKSLFRIVKKTLKYSDLLISCVMPEVLEGYGIKKDRMFMVTNGVDIDITKPIGIKWKDRIFRILYVGCVKKIRGIDTLLLSAKILNKSISNFKLTLVGPMENGDKEWLEDSIKGLELEKYVEFTGQLPHEIVLQYEEASDVCVFCFPEKRELNYIYPIKIFEYMAMGKAIVATNLKGVCRVIKDGVNGLIVKNEPEDIAGKILMLYMNPALRDKLGKRAVNDAVDYDWKKINDSIGRRISEMIERG